MNQDPESGIWTYVLLVIAYCPLGPVIGMCPWCGESLHPGRRCSNDD